MDWEIFVWMTSTILASIGAGVALWQARQTFGLRMREHRWRQTEMGKRLVDELFEEKRAFKAALMLDKMTHSLELADGQKVPVVFDDVQRALAAADNPRDERERSIVFCFGAFFYFIDRIEQFIEVDLVKLEDVTVPLEYYVNIISEDKSLYETYLNYVGYKRALKFFDRFEQWSKI